MDFKYLIALGTNIEPRSEYLSKSLTEMAKIGKIMAQSDIIESDPVGAANHPFLNGVVILASAIPPEPMLQQLLKIEEALGRTRAIRWGNRTIDLDIILVRYQNFWISGHTENLTIPHPEAHKRAFVLEPANQIATEWVFPDRSKTTSELLKELSETSSIQK